ncbi:hypothetical protein ITP53_29570 [Nonomuraea sp. K274]|uniref:Uncharacterized protein n=1 Tax=Nonomuraea cypriaca TaxID=1187855 RepID=A0A931AGP4_9ACTN|nr:hypothetical protein [Nonomuraea cypriaca]MBF8189805.1 hypothetical protein [Nonomuraea cypriaca]
MTQRNPAASALFFDTKERVLYLFEKDHSLAAAETQARFDDMMLRIEAFDGTPPTAEGTLALEHGKNGMQWRIYD